MCAVQSDILSLNNLISFLLLFLSFSSSYFPLTPSNIRLDPKIFWDVQHSNKPSSQSILSNYCPELEPRVDHVQKLLLLFVIIYELIYFLYISQKQQYLIYH